MQNKLAGKRIAILVADGFEQVEMTEPRKALEKAGAETDLISPAKGEVQAWKHQDKGDKFPVDIALEAADADNYDALLLPGGVANPIERYNTEFSAIDPLTGEVKAKTVIPFANYSGTLATAGGLLFTGFTDGTFMAYDDTTFAPLWKINVGTGFNAPPMTFETGGKQYVAILAGLVAQDPYLHIIGADLEDEPYGIGINLQNTGLVRFVNGTLERIRRDGTWYALYRKWLTVLGPAPAPVTAVSVAGGTTASPVQSTTAQPAVSTAGDSAFQSCVIERESGGNAQVMNASGHYGLYQFSASTWAAYGGNPADFGNASVAEQNQVFQNAIAAGGQSNWSLYDGC